jgi:hypothetical protein
MILMVEPSKVVMGTAAMENLSYVPDYQVESYHTKFEKQPLSCIREKKFTAVKIGYRAKNCIIKYFLA